MMKIPRIYSASFNGYISVIAEFEDEEIVSVDISFNNEEDVESIISLAEKVSKMIVNDMEANIGTDENSVIIRYVNDNGRNKICREFFSSDNVALNVANFLDDMIEEMLVEA